MIFIHILLGFAILMIGSDFEAISGRWARELALPGAGIIPYIRWIALGVYVSVIVFTRRNAKRWIRIGGILAGYILANTVIQYPNWLFKRSSEKIAIREFLPTSVVMNFQQHFGSPTVQYSSSDGTWLVVPSRKYTDSMRLWVKHQEKEEAK